ncbi:hypothetical protein [Hydrocarboniphaga effusa]|jgi:predicted small lipoprotein YifL|uniref:Periplasmic heavy metal sensor n=1 Tax=Hydrocarboniphaga effusa AP103 TaxID=1172194 RepID=I8HYP3_9GAMM|nr:hypothetical protein [Hydrocarboniphaga effusa]EIT68591.1 hypothetical protein WQQ_37860 [Hydrocarboniphaga effusa AP103]
MSISTAARTRTRHALLLATLLVLTACGGRGGPRGGCDRESPQQQRYSEKAVMRALGQVEADEQQRLAVLNAFDRDDAERRRLVTDGEQLRRDIASLSKSQPDYLARIEPLAKRKGELVTEELLIQARFDQAVVNTLTPEQLERWDEQFRQGVERGGFGESGGGRRGRRGPMG